MRSQAVAGLAALALAGCGSGEVAATPSSAVASSSSPTISALDSALGRCVSSEFGITTSDEGKSLTVTARDVPREGELDIEQVACLLHQLDTPDYVAEHMDTTRALDGQQTDSWGNIDARWTFHPDHGLRLTLVER